MRDATVNKKFGERKIFLTTISLKNLNLSPIWFSIIVWKWIKQDRAWDFDCKRYIKVNLE